MITIKNTDTQVLTWYALPKYGVDISLALAKGTIGPQPVGTCDPKITVNLLLALETNKFVALCTAGQNATVVFHNPFFGAWCHVS